MSIDIKMTYTDNPYIDILVYYTKVLAIGTVLKMKTLADRYETVESLKNADMLIACKEGTVVFNLFDSFSEDVLRKSGLIGLPLAQAIMNKDTIPQSLRDTVVKNASEEFINNYEEQNNYYRMLCALPPNDYTDVYVTDWEPPEGVIINLDIPVHEMSADAIAILKTYGVLDDMIEADPVNRAYLKYLDKSIDPYAARKAGPFDVLYLPTIDSTEIEKEYRDRLEINKDYTIRSVYSEAYNYDSDYYDNIMAVFIVINTMIDIICRVQEFITRKEVFDLRTVQYIFESNGVDFFPEIPLRYQIAMVKNLHTLLKYKSTAKCMVEICSIFGMKNIQIFKYYLLRNRKVDKETNEFSFSGDVEEDFDLKFVKIPIDEPMDDYIRDPAYYADYDEIVEGDPTWDGGLEHDYVKKQHLEYNFNYIRTKYLSIESIYEIAKMSAQQSYFFNMLYDNAELEDLILVNVPYISSERGFKLADLFTFLTSLTHYYYGNKDLILDTQGKVLYVNGFNFKADLASIAETLEQLRFDKEAQELLSQFNIPTDSIPSFKQLMNLFVNNMNIRDLLIKGMKNADSLRHYKPYKLLYDSLMTVELTFDHFKNPETNDFYRDGAGDATYAAYLQAQDPILYYKLVEIQLVDDDDTRKQQIANLIDNITYILEEYIDTEKFAYIFHGLPAVSVDAVKQYINSVIDFYKSYKVHILGINTLYYFDDPNEGYIRLIDDVLLNRWFEKDEIVNIIDRICGMNVNLTKEEKINFVEKVYLDISTWAYKNYRDDINIKDFIKDFLLILYKDDEIMMNEELSYKVNMLKESSITLIDNLDSMSVNISKEDSINITDRMWINQVYTLEYKASRASSIVEFEINNIEVPANGSIVVANSSIHDFTQAKFELDISMNDMENTTVCNCDEGKVTVTNYSDYAVLGIIRCKNDMSTYFTIYTE